MSRGILKKDSSPEWAAEIKRLRLARGLSQDRLAALLGVASSSVGFWETGKITPPHLTAEWVRLVLLLPPDQLRLVEKAAEQSKKTLAQVCADLITFALEHLGPSTSPGSFPSPQGLEAQIKKHKKDLEAQKNVPVRRRLDKSA